MWVKREIIRILNQLKIVVLKLSNEIKAALIIFGGILLFLIGFNFSQWHLTS